ncbi:MAG TPA: hypothetical protein VK816_11295 [Jatrophihabitantaceae bacterium]|jgi:hypothetical protein|nr:hypothetical protein [Jatrophihabitantaceae bacterium]
MRVNSQASSHGSVNGLRWKVIGAVIAGTLVCGGGILAVTATPAYSAPPGGACSIPAEYREMADIIEKVQYIDNRSNLWDAQLRTASNLLENLHDHGHLGDADALSLIDSFEILVHNHVANAEAVAYIKQEFGPLYAEYQHMLNGTFVAGQAEDFVAKLNNLRALVQQYADSPSGHAADLAAGPELRNWINNKLVPAAARQHFTLNPMLPGSLG